MARAWSPVPTRFSINGAYADGKLLYILGCPGDGSGHERRREGVMRDGIYIVDGDGHVMDFPHRCYQKFWDSEWPHTVDELMRRDDLNARVKAKILGQNALRFYDLKAPVSR
jgi:hypothetical protein